MKGFPFGSRLLAGLVVAALSASTAQAYTTITYYADEDHPSADDHDDVGHTPGTPLALPDSALGFRMQADARAYWEMASKAHALPIPDARSVAKALLLQRLGVDGDAYVVAHFATSQDWAQGKPDHTMPLTDALMEAFPEHDRHSTFAAWADTVGGVMTGGQASPGPLAFIEQARHCRSVRQCFSSIGGYLWSHTGPGYIYKLLFARGNVVETVREDARSLDEAFGVFAVGKGFAGPSDLVLSQVIRAFEADGVFSELPYVRKLHADMDAYWAANRDEWPVLARYRFVQQAREARVKGKLTQEAYAQVMREGAPRVPLEGAITLAQLRDGSRATGGRAVRRLDINGYFATDLLRFVASDGSEVLYLPGAAEPFLEFANEEKLRQWVLAQTEDARKLDALLSRFSRYDRQDGTFWTGVEHGLENIAKGQWKADASAIDHADAVMAGDVFVDLCAQVDNRMREDARVLASTAWEGWRTTLNRTAALLGPIGYLPPLAIPVQLGTGLVSLGTGLDEGFRGRTSEARKRGLGQAAMTFVTNVPLGVAYASVGKAGEGQAPARFVPPRRVNGKIGYLMGPPKAPMMPEEAHPQFDPLPTSSVWTQPGPHAEVRSGGYVVMVVPENSVDRVSAVIDLKKRTIDELHRQLSDVEEPATTGNGHGFLVSTDRSLAFRVDSRSPMTLVENGGFGPSREFFDVDPMLDGLATIGSRSLRGSDVVFKYWPQASTNEHSGDYHQYVVWTRGREVADVAENEIVGADHALEEVHFAADIPASDIYIIDSMNPDYAKAISEIVESDHVATPYGVPIEAFTEYLAGRLDIHAPNRFSEQRL
ncbi:dermonecrotic toxin domain-containing protein [Luteibacter sp. UNCMF366Tsu5.1]|uniref:dermonecrotic toxin domain-containing protein n=1 Tax=Luteibacter sp. UNCMF366Tsu5.1 TaxID=1502758 RepID=UPI0009086186|nr:DUF6543 domain-containing protein [Luteibacter sp. UNCMF366Tsu5.1]SFW30226.1 hypothetical protein SAMN02800691_0885 [Luteibacter sp. UNCMF366Tsu5.1]